jgi:hypothetical protein
MPLLCTLWGVVTMWCALVLSFARHASWQRSQGWVQVRLNLRKEISSDDVWQTQGQLNACRFLLGIFEGGL